MLTVSSSDSSVAVVIDSLSPLLSHNSTNHVCSSLRKLLMPNDNFNQGNGNVVSIVTTMIFYGYHRLLHNIEYVINLQTNI